LLIKDVAGEFGDREKVVTEEYGNTPTAEKWGVRRYPVVFVDDVLVARPKDFGFGGEDDTSKGLYVPWREPASQGRFQADLRRFVQMRLTGAHVAGLDLADVRTEVVSADGPAEYPSVALRTIDGRTVESASLAGKVVVVEMWATWCPPCRSTLAWLNTLRARYGDRVTVVAISVDSAEQDVAAMTAGVNANYHVVPGTPEVIARFGEIAAVPKLFIFDRGRRRTHTFYGAPPDLHERVAAAIDGLLRSNPAHTPERGRSVRA
jgi:thiol-disulfide isomerase/thioredoxin